MYSLYFFDHWPMAIAFPDRPLSLLSSFVYGFVYPVQIYLSPSVCFREFSRCCSFRVNVAINITKNPDNKHIGFVSLQSLSVLYVFNLFSIKKKKTSETFRNRKERKKREREKFGIKFSVRFYETFATRWNRMK